MDDNVRTERKKRRPVIEKTEDGLRVNLMKHQLAARNSTKQIAGIVGSRACGKSIYMSVEAFLEIVQGRRVVVMAQNYKALKINIFREIITRFHEAGLVPEVNQSDMSIRYGKGELFGFTYESIDSTRGLSEISLLLLDELAYAPPNLLATVTPCLRGAGGSRIRYGTSPKKGSIWNKWFKDASVDKDMFTATMFDNDQLDEEDYEIQKKAIKDDLQYRQEIMGEILDDDVEFGIIKQLDYPSFRKAPYGIHRLGIDCAGSGADFNWFTVVDDSSILEQCPIQQADTYGMYNTAADLIKKYDIRKVRIDVTGGFGNGVRDMLKKNFPRLDIEGVNFGQGAVDDKTYLNARAEMYFNLVTKIRDNGFYVDDNRIKEELQFTTYDITNSGKTVLCPKEAIKKLLGRSPDASDALALALYDDGVEPITPQEALGIAMKFACI